MVVMNDQGMQNMLSQQIKLGADASVAAGPVVGAPRGRFDGLGSCALRYELIRAPEERYGNHVEWGSHQAGSGRHHGHFMDVWFSLKLLLTGNFSPTPNDAAPWMSALVELRAGSGGINNTSAGATATAEGNDPAAAGDDAEDPTTTPHSPQR